jgi:DNA-binding Xre family transcriptional regulator
MAKISITEALNNEIKERMVNQRKLAKSIGQNPSSFWRMMKQGNDLKYSTLCAICDSLKVDVRDVISKQMCSK